MFTQIPEAALKLFRSVESSFHNNFILSFSSEIHSPAGFFDVLTFLWFWSLFLSLSCLSVSLTVAVFSISLFLYRAVIQSCLFRLSGSHLFFLCLSHHFSLFLSLSPLFPWTSSEPVEFLFSSLFFESCVESHQRLRK